MLGRAACSAGGGLAARIQVSARSMAQMPSMKPKQITSVRERCCQTDMLLFSFWLCDSLSQAALMAPGSAFGPPRGLHSEL